MTHTIDNNKLALNYDVVVIGAGHAGCEAALACSRLGLETIMFTVSVDSIALMPCNPHIGGSSKGHLVREIDALGGEMGKNIDKTFIQSKMLNVSKGPAVHSLRTQADKQAYSKSMRNVLETQEHLTIKQGEVCEILWENIEKNDSDKINSDKINSSEAIDNIDNCINKNDTTVINSTDISANSDIDYSALADKKIVGVKSYTGTTYYCKAIVICTGTYLNARCLCGEAITYTGPNNLQSSTHLSDSLKKMGIELRRFKTGTPARMDGKTIDYSKLSEQKGDEKVIPFSFSTDPKDVQIDQVSCWLTYTNENTHNIIRANLDRSPIYAGIIEGTGPRYCPSIEDKVVKFADKDRHQVFLEPEGRYTNEVYVDGMSSSLPEDVQLAMYRTVPGLEHCRIVRNAYAIEYDCINAKQLYNTLQFKNVCGLYAGGQFNGSSGYEEAAAQGLIAGINAAMYIIGKKPLILDRSESYIGVLIDDLVTKDNREPYRMMTSKAEYRLLLRQDNADIRLRKYGYEVGLVSRATLDDVLNKEKLISEEIDRLKTVTVGGNKIVTEFLNSHNSAPLTQGVSLASLLCRPEISYKDLAEIDPDRPSLSDSVIEQVEIEIRYEGYIERQKKQVDHFKKMENRKIPADINYDLVPSLRIEARQKLKEFRPLSIGQASRLSGVSPADVSVLLVYLEKEKH